MQTGIRTKSITCTAQMWQKQLILLKYHGTRAKMLHYIQLPLYIILQMQNITTTTRIFSV